MAPGVVAAVRHEPLSVAGYKVRPKTSFLVGGVTLLVAASISGRSPDLPIDRQIATTSTPAYCNTAHNVGKIALTVGNSGLLGTGGAMNDMDCFTGAYLPSCEYPIGSNSIYLWAASLWVGAVVGEDTLVSTGFNLGPGSKEFHPDASPTGDIDYRSILNPTSPAYEGAVSEQDFVARYSDTCLDCLVGGNDPWDNRPHLPLGIEVTQHSYAWGHPYIDDFVLFSDQYFWSKPLSFSFILKIFSIMSQSFIVSICKASSSVTLNITVFLPTLLPVFINILESLKYTLPQSWYHILTMSCLIGLF